MKLPTDDLQTYIFEWSINHLSYLFNIGKSLNKSIYKLFKV